MQGEIRIIEMRAGKCAEIRLAGNDQGVYLVPILDVSHGDRRDFCFVTDTIGKRSLEHRSIYRLRQLGSAARRNIDDVAAMLFQQSRCNYRLSWILAAWNPI